MVYFWGIILIGMAGMLAVMGVQQYRRKFRTAAGFSLGAAVLLAVAAVWILVA